MFTFKAICVTFGCALVTSVIGSPISVGPTVARNFCPWTTQAATSPEVIVQNWYSLWAGDYTLLKSTVMPDVQLYQDRFPTGPNSSASLPINNSSALLDFVKLSRADFESYKFIDDFHFGVANALTLRWTLNATFSGSPTATLPAGSHVSYNGTDIMLLEPCSGLIQQVLSAQDLITYFHELGQSVGSP